MTTLIDQRDLLGLASCASAAPDDKILAIPDFTKGTTIPAEAQHD